LFRKVITVSDTERALPNYGMNDPFEYQTQKRMVELARDIELAAIAGTTCLWFIWCCSFRLTVQSPSSPLTRLPRLRVLVSQKISFNAPFEPGLQQLVLTKTLT
jgi:hypothetical protein